MFTTAIETTSLLFTQREAIEKQDKTIITSTQVGIVPPRTIGTVNGMTQKDIGFLLNVQWSFPEPSLTGNIDKEEYEQQFELPLTLQGTLEAVYFSLDLQRHFNDDELKSLTARLKITSRVPVEFERILRFHPALMNRIEVISLACELAIALDRNTERRWTARMIDTITRKLTLVQIAELYQEFNNQDERLGLGAESRIVRNACDLILRANKKN